MAKKFKLIGTNDEADTCCCCGKSGLKRVVWLVPLDVDGNPEGEAEHYGTSCAARMLGWSHATSAKAKKAIEVLADSASRETVREAVSKIRAEHCAIYNGMHFVLKSDLTALTEGEINIQAAIKHVRSAFPITRYFDGNMSLKEAFSLAKATI